jgi:hypothetical protein
MMPEIGTVPIGPLTLQTIGTAPVVATLMFGLGAWAFRSGPKIVSSMGGDWVLDYSRFAYRSGAPFWIILSAHF